MKYVKMLGLAAVAAAALMAFAGSASATVLCQTNPTSGECATSPGDYASGTKIVGTDAAAVLTSDLLNVTCHSETTVESTGTGGGAGVAVPGKILSLNFTNCNNGCTVVVLKTPKIKVAWTSKANGTLTNETAGETGEASVSCPLLQCKFALEPDLGVTGGNPAKVKASAVKLTIIKSEGFITCPKEAFWDATYTAKSINGNAGNTALYVANKMA